MSSMKSDQANSFQRAGKAVAVALGGLFMNYLVPGAPHSK
jgi:hypothetical protein